MIITILVARNLGVEPVGRFAVLAALIGISRVASDFGFDRYLPRQLISSDDAPQRVIEATAARAVTGAICAFGVVVVGSLLLGPSSEVLVAALVPICATPVIIATSWTLARGTTRVLLPSAIVGFLVTIAIAVASTRGLGLAALFAAMAIGVTTEGALGWRLSGVSGRRESISGVAVGAVRHLKQATPFAAQSLVGVVYARIPVLALATVGSVTVATFASAYNMYAAAALIPAALGLATYPRLTRAFGEGDKNGFTLATEAYVAAAGAFVVGAIVFGLLAGPIIETLYGPAFVAAIPVLRVLTLGLVITSANAYFSVALFALRADRAAVAISFAALAVLVAGLGMSLAYGATGAAVALVVAESCAMFAAITIFRRRLRALY